MSGFCMHSSKSFVLSVVLMKVAEILIRKKYDLADVHCDFIITRYFGEGNPCDFGVLLKNVIDFVRKARERMFVPFSTYPRHCNPM